MAVVLMGKGCKSSPYNVMYLLSCLKQCQDDGYKSKGAYWGEKRSRGDDWSKDSGSGYRQNGNSWGGGGRRGRDREPHKTKEELDADLERYFGREAPTEGSGASKSMDADLDKYMGRGDKAADEEKPAEEAKDDKEAEKAPVGCLELIRFLFDQWPSRFLFDQRSTAFCWHWISGPAASVAPASGSAAFRKMSGAAGVISAGAAQPLFADKRLSRFMLTQRLSRFMLTQRLSRFMLTQRPSRSVF
ncbi:unnamed protein product [Symbiodinium natans]|uniref:Chromatin target of PRMT1 protein C-terminal domain-containing protein n=1 Tax=Symbiodinium natans TaxID=878477 RepID=A0A812H3M5_9DINO|nr:unnamed protein product [Symbiodinium natans]